MDNNKFIALCQSIVAMKENQKRSGTEPRQLLLNPDDVFVVWSCKTLQNNKAILSFAETGSPLYEITHNGDKNQVYVDVYVKESNECITLD